MRAIPFVAVVAIVLWTASGWAQGGSVEFKPAIEELKVDARPAPVKVATEDASTLTSKGYAWIGTITASLPGKKASPEIAKQLEVATLRKAAEVGGDVVVFSKEAVRETMRVKVGERCPRGTWEMPQNKPGQPIPGGDACPGQHIAIYKNFKGLVTAGEVWRQDSNLAEKIRRAKQKNSFSNLWAAIDDKDLTKIRAIVNDCPESAASRNKLGETPLHWAALEGHNDLVELLLAHGADVNAKDNGNYTALHEAALAGHNDLVELLLAHGADVNTKDKDGFTALHDAAWHGYKDVVELLLAHGADVNAKDNNGYTALSSAVYKCYKDVVELLLAHGADVNAKNNTTRSTALHDAAWHGYKDVVELLLAHGADINAKDNIGYTALHEAEVQRHNDVAELLRQRGGHE
jgi:ankyrin repeat protein